jgi:hypothetical protein
MRPGKEYGPERLEAACTRARATRTETFGSIESILKRKLDRRPLEHGAIENGIVTLEKVCGGDNRAVYLITNIVAEKAAEVTPGPGSGDSIRAWLDGGSILGHKAVRPVVVDSDKVPPKLEKGGSQLLLKVAGLSGNRGACADADYVK